MASAGGVGLDVDLSAVPVREQGMEPFEIMISESQERMAAIVEPGSWPAVEALCRRWEIDATVIGEVTETGHLRAFHAGELVGDIPVTTLTDDAPRYELACERPSRLEDEPRAALDPETTPDVALRALLASPGIASRAWVTRQYDQLVGSGTVVRPGGDAAVVRLTPSNRAIAISLDGNGRRTWLDPRRGGMSAVCEAARNVACTGARPAAVTNCLNFGNPEDPEIGYELAEAIAGMAAACSALGLPVVSGNVSLYNEHDGRPILPTPVVGVVGVLDDAELAVRIGFHAAGDVVLLAGAGTGALDGSDYQKVILGEVAGRIPEPDLEAERALHAFLAAAAERKLLRSAHDVGGGGLAVAVAESAMAGGIGVRVEEAGDLFGEGDGRVVVSARRADVAALRKLASGVPLRRLGAVGGTEIAVGPARIALAEAVSAYEGAIPRIMDGAA
jgi:phosphoribosylformylglycinamidine synthase